MGATTFLKNSIVENIVRRTPGFYSHFIDRIIRSEAMPIEERRLLRNELTSRTLARARKALHGRTMPACGLYDDWPLLEKDSLRENADLCSVRTMLPSHGASTGGTTGIPLLLKRSLQSVVFEQAILDHLVQRHAGLELKTARVAVLRGDTFKRPDDMAAPHWVLKQGGRQLSCSSIHLNAATISEFVTAIRDFKPDILWVYPSSLAAFARLGAGLLRDNPIASLKLVLSSSEVLDSDLHREVSLLLGVPVLDYYGQSERVCASYRIHGDDHYFLPAYGRVDLQPMYDEGGFSYYEIIGTSYWNPAQPLVRFRTGDMAKLPRGLDAQQLEAVTLGTQPFLGIEGRRSEYIMSPEGTRIIGINHIPRNVPHIAQMQLVQTEPSSVTIKIVPLPGFGDESLAAILANARKKLPETIAIRTELVGHVSRTASGKAPLVLRIEDTKSAPVVERIAA